MLSNEVTTPSLAKEDHSKLTTIVVCVLFAVASLEHALLATVCMHTWNLLAQMLHQDPKHQPALARVLAHPFVFGKQMARLAGREETQGRRDVGHMDPLDQDWQTGRIPDKTARNFWRTLSG